MSIISNSEKFTEDLISKRESEQPEAVQQEQTAQHGTQQNREWWRPTGLHAWKVYFCLGDNTDSLPEPERRFCEACDNIYKWLTFDYRDILRQYCKGVSVAKVAESWGVSTSTVYRKVKMAERAVCRLLGLLK